MTSIYAQRRAALAAQLGHGGVAIGRDDQPGVRFREARQVKKVAVVAVGEIAVAVAGALRRCRDDGHTARAQLGGQCGAALRVDGGHGGIVGGAP